MEKEKMCKDLNCVKEMITAFLNADDLVDTRSEEEKKRWDTEFKNKKSDTGRRRSEEFYDFLRKENELKIRVLSDIFDAYSKAEGIHNDALLNFEFDHDDDVTTYCAEVRNMCDEDDCRHYY